MNNREIKLIAALSVFPLQGKFTREIKDKADIYDGRKCNGALTLKAALPKGFPYTVQWGVTSGYAYDKSGKEVMRITTKSGVNFYTPHLKLQKVTFTATPLI